MKCPRCGAPTVQRTNRATGVEFTGCSAFPRCRWSFNPNASLEEIEWDEQDVAWADGENEMGDHPFTHDDDYDTGDR